MTCFIYKCNMADGQIKGNDVGGYICIYACMYNLPHIMHIGCEMRVK